MLNVTAIFLSIISIGLAITAILTARSSRSDANSILALLKASKSGGIRVERLVVGKADGGAFVIIEPGSIRACSGPGTCRISIDGDNKPRIAIFDKAGKERAVLGVVDTKISDTGTAIQTSEGNLGFFDINGRLLLNIPDQQIDWVR